MEHATRRLTAEIDDLRKLNRSTGVHACTYLDLVRRVGWKPAHLLDMQAALRRDLLWVESRLRTVRWSGEGPPTPPDRTGETRPRVARLGPEACGDAPRARARAGAPPPAPPPDRGCLRVARAPSGRSAHSPAVPRADAPAPSRCWPQRPGGARAPCDEIGRVPGHRERPDPLSRGRRSDGGVRGPSLEAPHLIRG